MGDHRSGLSVGVPSQLNVNFTSRWPHILVSRGIVPAPQRRLPIVRGHPTLANLPLDGQFIVGGSSRHAAVEKDHDCGKEGKNDARQQRSAAL